MEELGPASLNDEDFYDQLQAHLNKVTRKHSRFVGYVSSQFISTLHTCFCRSRWASASNLWPKMSPHRLNSRSGCDCVDLPLKTVRVVCECRGGLVHHWLRGKKDYMLFPSTASRSRRELTRRHWDTIYGDDRCQHQFGQERLCPPQGLQVSVQLELSRLLRPVSCLDNFGWLSQLFLANIGRMLAGTWRKSSSLALLISMRWSGGQ